MIIYCRKRAELRPWMITSVMIIMKWVCHTRFFYSLTGSARPVIAGFMGKGHPIVVDPCSCLLFYGKDSKGTGYILEGSKGAYWD